MLPTRLVSACLLQPLPCAAPVRYMFTETEADHNIYILYTRIMDLDIHVESLLSAIESRPILWDKRQNNVKNKLFTYNAWKEVFTCINEDYLEMSPKDQAEFGKEVMKKWTNIRDNFIKCNRKIREHEKGKGPKPRKYVYYDKLLFLISQTQPQNSNRESNNDPDSMYFENGSADSDVSEGESPRRRKRPKLEPIEEGPDGDNMFDNWTIPLNPLDTSETTATSSKVMSFFEGIASTVEKFNDEDMVEFQFEVVKAMRNIIHKRKSQAT